MLCSNHELNGISQTWILNEQFFSWYNQISFNGFHGTMPHYINSESDPLVTDIKISKDAGTPFLNVRV